jgi:hypothetical protein
MLDDDTSVNEAAFGLSARRKRSARPGGLSLRVRNYWRYSWAFGIYRRLRSRSNLAQVPGSRMQIAQFGVSWIAGAAAAASGRCWLLARFWAAALGYVLEPPPEGFATWDDWRRDIGLPDSELGIGADSIIDPRRDGPRHLVPCGAGR